MEVAMSDNGKSGNATYRGRFDRGPAGSGNFHVLWKILAGAALSVIVLGVLFKLGIHIDHLIP